MKHLPGTIAIIVTLLSIANTLPAQEAPYDEVRARLEKLETSIQIVLGYNLNPNRGRIELVEGQKEQLVLLDEKYQQLIDQVQILGDGPDQRKAALAIYGDTMISLSSTLHDEILLPHQSEVLESLVFARFLKSRGGDLFESIETYYQNQFGLSDEQKEELKAIQKEAAKKVAEAKERFRKELEKIATETRKEVRTVLTPKQKQLLEKLEDKNR